jgi:sec-independent protein translocase protein TatA
MDIGPTELIIILVIVLLLFGVGRIGKIAGELGSGIRAFREGLQGGDEEKPAEETLKDEVKE